MGAPWKGTDRGAAVILGALERLFALVHRWA